VETPKVRDVLTIIFFIK